MHYGPLKFRLLQSTGIKWGICKIRCSLEYYLAEIRIPDITVAQLDAGKIGAQAESHVAEFHVGPLSRIIRMEIQRRPNEFSPEHVDVR